MKKNNRESDQRSDHQANEKKCMQSQALATIMKKTVQAIHVDAVSRNEITQVAEQKRPGRS